MSAARRVAYGVVVVVLVAAAAAFALTTRSAIPAISPPARAAFENGLIAKGETLAAMGDCMACHTAPEGKPFAGGLSVPTPFGTIYSTNITPDAETGIGRWSEAAFVRAMREGVDREGDFLYPAFPYDHFTHIDDGDLKALYAYLMTRTAVSAEAPANTLPFPLNFRPVLAGWNLLFLRGGPIPQDASKGPEWNRGAYLVEGLGHCGACHTPRNALGGERQAEAFAGGTAENWHAPALDATSPAPVPWTVETMTAYLRRGWAEQHSASSGPMQVVYHNLGEVPESDVKAMATYLVAKAGPPSADRQKRAADAIAKAAANPAGGSAAGEGADVFAGACANCHRNGGPTLAGRLPMGLYTAVNAPDPRNLIHVVMDGLRPREGEAGPMMPGFAPALTDAQIAALVTFIRGRYSDRPAWSDVAATVKALRAERD
ncbi:MAG: cytochrome c [Bauldia sp.]